MKASWTNGLEPDAAKEIKGDFISSHLVRKRLVLLLQDKIKVADKASLLLEYDVSNWALKQADYVGYKRAINDIIDLITEK